MRSIVALVAVSVAIPALAQEAPDAVQPVPPWSPTGAGFEKRVNQLNKHEKANNPTNDARVRTTLMRVTARNGSRSWLAKKVWTEGKARFAVAKVTDVQNIVDAIRAAEQKARTAVGSDGAKDSRRLLDWYVDDNGTAYVLVGRWLSVEELEKAQ